MFYSQAGHYFAWLYARSEARREMKEQFIHSLPDSELEIISLTDNIHDIKWEEEGREFLYKGEMYDVARIKTVDGKTLLYCVNDEKETALMDQLSDSVQSIHQHNNGKNSKVTFLKLAVDPAIIETIEFSLLCISQKSIYARFEAHLPVLPPLISSPPPKC
jgi:hypothetical protein